MIDKNTIELFDVGGTSRLSGEDAQGCVWTQFEVDYQAEQEAGECIICEAQIPFTGWMCMDGGDEVCEYHVRIMNHV